MQFIDNLENVIVPEPRPDQSNEKSNLYMTLKQKMKHIHTKYECVDTSLNM